MQRLESPPVKEGNGLNPCQPGTDSLLSSAAAPLKQSGGGGGRKGIGERADEKDGCFPIAYSYPVELIATMYMDLATPWTRDSGSSQM